MADCRKSGRAGGCCFLKPFTKMERRNDFHDNNSIRERNEGSWREILKGRCHCCEPGGSLRKSGGLNTIKTLKHKTLIIACELDLSKGNTRWEEPCEQSRCEEVEG